MPLPDPRLRNAMGQVLLACVPGLLALFWLHGRLRRRGEVPLGGLVVLCFVMSLVAAPLWALVGFGVYAFVWGTLSTTVRQRLVPLHLQGRIASVNMVGVFGGLVIGQGIGGVIAQTWGLTAPWWFAFGGSALTLVIVWRSLSAIAAAPPALDDAPGLDSV